MKHPHVLTDIPPIYGGAVRVNRHYKGLMGMTMLGMVTM